MSIEIHINKDVGSFEARFIGPFTLRQIICITIAAPICWFVYKYTAPILSEDVAGFLMAIPGGIAYLFGWKKPYGMRTEKFVRSIFVNMVLAPSHRKYKTVNVHERAFALLEAHEKQKEAQNQPKKHIKKTQRKKQPPVSPDAVR